jgi:hypothetical protein
LIELSSLLLARGEARWIDKSKSSLFKTFALDLVFDKLQVLPVFFQEDHQK